MPTHVACVCTKKLPLNAPEKLQLTANWFVRYASFKKGNWKTNISISNQSDKKKFQMLV